MPLKRQISAIDIVQDMRMGMSDAQMMKKYKLSPVGLKNAFKKLLEAKLVTPFEFAQWSSLFCEGGEARNVRLFPRDIVASRLPIYEAGPSKKQGRVLNVSDTGIGVFGIEAKIGDTKTFIIPIKGAPVIFAAECRWVKREPVKDNWISGFDIIEVHKGNWDRILELIRAISLKRRQHAKPTVLAAETKPTPVMPVTEPTEQTLPVDIEQSHRAASEIPPATQDKEPKPHDLARNIEKPAVSTRGIPEKPTLASVQEYLDSNNYIHLLTNRQYLMFIVNPLNFTELLPENRRRMLDKVSNLAGSMLVDLRKKTKAFQDAIENSTLLVNP